MVRPGINWRSACASRALRKVLTAAGIGHLQPREQAGDGVAALNALFAPESLVGIIDCRRIRQRDLLDDLGDDRLVDHGIGGDAEGGDHP